MKTRILNLCLATGLFTIAATMPTDINQTIFQTGWVATAQAQRIGWTNVELIYSERGPGKDGPTTTVNLNGQAVQSVSFPVGLLGDDKPSDIQFQSGCGFINLPVSEQRATSAFSTIEDSGVRAKAFYNSQGELMVRLRAKGNGIAGLQSCVSELIFEEPFEGPAPLDVEIRTDLKQGIDIPLSNGETITLERAIVRELNRDVTGKTTATAIQDTDPDSESVWKKLKFRTTRRGNVALVAEAIGRDPAISHRLSGTVMDGGSGVPLLSAVGIEPRLSTRSFNGISLFADPDSVIDMKYLAELTLLDANKEELGYIEVLITGTEASASGSSELETGGVVQSNNTEGIDANVLLFQNEDGETFTTSITVDAENMPQISEIAVFLTPQDGGSDADPEDFVLPFVESCDRFVIKGNSGLGNTAEAGITYNVSVANGDNVKSRIFGDLDDFPGGIQEGKGKGTKRSCSSAASRPQLQ